MFPAGIILSSLESLVPASCGSLVIPSVSGLPVPGPVSPVVALQLGGDLVWVPGRWCRPFWSVVVFVERYWYKYGQCFGGTVTEASLGLILAGFFCAVGRVHAWCFAFEVWV